MLEPVGLEPAGRRKRSAQLRQRADQHDIDGVAG